MQETYYRPDETSRSTNKLAPSVFNAYRLLLARSTGDCVFVPLRSMQFQSVATSNEIIFIDSYGPYYSDGDSAGRCISFAWQFTSPMIRDSLTEPIDYDWVCYCDSSDATSSRLISEFNQAVNYYLAKLPGKSDETPEINIIPLPGKH